MLVTDLDGTLLEGSIASRLRLYSWLRSRRQRVLHVFCMAATWNRWPAC
ncbi:HAD family hydrolase [Synechococcus sp. RedBA-s]|nr:HAD family hydrolase [Synechococcus sp. RedBA-s]